MTTKVVYFTVGDKPEQAEFATDFPADEIKGTGLSLCLHVHFFYCPLCEELCVTGFNLIQILFYSTRSLIHSNKYMVVEGNTPCVV